MAKDRRNKASKRFKHLALRIFFIAERGDWNGKCFPILTVKIAKDDGGQSKPETWYALKDGSFVEV